MPPSGGWWVSQFPTSQQINDLEPTFRSHVLSFVQALTKAQAHVKVTATRRPRKRAYLMHYSWCIVHAWQGCNPSNVPAYEPSPPGEGGIDIQWLHTNSAGLPDIPASKAAAQQMVSLYQMNHLHTPPALNSLHIQGKAIDMAIGWQGTLKILDAHQKSVDIASEPRDGTNPDLIKVGATYQVFHFINVQKDPPHWSVNGH